MLNKDRVKIPGFSQVDFFFLILFFLSFFHSSLGFLFNESKNKFVKQLVFPSYEVMKTSCPWLKTPILLPAAWLVRYKRALTASRGNIGYHIERAKTFDRVEDQEQKERCQFFERCGLEDVSENF